MQTLHYCCGAGYPDGVGAALSVSLVCEVLCNLGSALHSAAEELNRDKNSTS